MSEIRATTISDAAGTGPIALTKQSAAKAWVNFNQTIPSVDDSFSISSVIDNSSGNSTNNFSTDMANSGYSETASAVDDGVSFMFTSIDSLSASSCKTVTFRNTSVSTTIDGNTVCTSIHGDLA